jgi:uncharacterized membrane protein YraQ (UPF0718 family)
VNTEYIDKTKDFILTFTSIFYEALPFIVLGVIIAGLLQEFLPQRLVVKVLPRSRTLAILIGGVLGLIFPMCECGIIPVMRRLLRKGFPLSCCIAYLLAGPIINFVVILATLVAFSGMGDRPGQMGGITMASLRVGMGYIVAVVTALVVERQYQKYGDKLLAPIARPGKLPLIDEDEDPVDVPRKPWGKRLSNVAETALHDFVDITAFLIIGALLAATARIVLPNETMARLSHSHVLLTIAAMMGFAIVVTLCSEADAFVAASFSTMAPSAKLAFLVLGPMLDMKLILMYMRVFRPRLIWTIIVCIVVQIFVYSYIVHLVWVYGIPNPVSGDWLIPSHPLPQ